MYEKKKNAGVVQYEIGDRGIRANIKQITVSITNNVPIGK